MWYNAYGDNVMKDLMKLVDEVKNDLDALNIPYRKVKEWSVGIKSKYQWGRCEQIKDGLFNIKISEKLLQDDLDDQHAKNTIAHELLHTVKGCMNHKEPWKKLVKLLNTKIPSYNVTTTLNHEAVGLYVERKVPVYKYFFRCKKCGAELKYQRKSKFVEHSDRYHCSRCGGKFERIQ